MNDAGRFPAGLDEADDEQLNVDLCVIGGGSGGLSVAAGAAQMGARVVLIERGPMGGDCLNTGCVPSKALIAAAHHARALADGAPFGIHTEEARTAFGEVHEHVHGVIAAIAPHDSVERFEGLGVTVIRAAARFADRRTVLAGTRRVRARRFVVATGSRPAVPPIPGLDEVRHLTNETIFELTERPKHLIVLGGGPIGVELAQAFRRLGSLVTLIEQARILPRDEPEAAAVVHQALADEGVEIVEGRAACRITACEEGVAVALDPDETGPATVCGSHLLVATGRRPTLGELDLEAAGITHDASGIKVDKRLRTTNRRIFAVGDVCGGPQFTHIAGYQAGIVVRNALFALPARVDYRALPWVTYSDPELAHVGLTEAQAGAQGRRVSTLIEPMKGNDRAQAERRTEGLAKIVVGPRGAILGATIVAPHAGELIGLWGLAISQGLKLSAIASLILPYPTFAEISKRAAGSHFTPTLYGARMQRVVRAVQRLVP